MVAMRRLLIGLAFAVASAAPAHAQQLLGTIPITQAGRMPIPAGVATDAHGHVFVSTWRDKGEILEYTVTGELVRSFAHGIAFAAGLAAAPDGNLYVVEHLSPRRVSVWGPSGRLVRAFGTGDNAAGSKLEDPQGIVIDSQGTVYVADRGRIAVFTSAGRFLRSITVGTPAEPVYGSAGIALAPDGTLWVIDRDHYRAYHVTTAGTALGSFALPRSGGGALRFPTWVAASEAGLIITDDGDRGLQQFAFDGSFRSSIDTEPPLYAAGVAVDCRGSVYVAEETYGRLLRFGQPGAASCGDPAADPNDRLRLIASAPARQRFARRFAVTIGAGCNRACIATATGSVVIGRGSRVPLGAQSGARFDPGSTRLVLGPTEAGIDRVIAALRHGRKVVARLRVTGVDTAGQRRTVTRTVRLSL